MELAAELSRQGHSVTLYAILGDYDYTTISKDLKITIKSIPTYFQVSSFSSDGYKKRTLVDQILTKFLGKLIEFPDIEFYFSIPRIVYNEKQYEAIISIANPHPIHWGTARAKRKFPAKFPKTWIADCGDPYMKNGKSNKKQKWFNSFEKRFCNSADFITVPVQNAIEFYFCEYLPKIKVIPQGFNFDLPIQREHVSCAIPTFLFAGTFIKEMRDPRPFLKFLRSLKIDFKFIIYTSHTDLIKNEIRLLGDKVEVHEYIDRASLIKIMKRVSFLINIENLGADGQTPSKLIDYAIAGRPILSIKPEKLNEKLILEFLSGDYRRETKMHQVEDYHIKKIANSFTDLLSK